MYFPWAGFIGQMARADVFIWLDDAQFSKGSFTNRVQVKTNAGRTWMTVPLVGKGTFEEIRELRATDVTWKVGHRDLLRQQLRDAAFLDMALDVFDEAVAHDRLVDVLIDSATVMAKALGIKPATVLRSSEMNVRTTSTQRVIDLVQAVGGDLYLTGHGASRYLDHDLFEQVGINVEYMTYDITPWPQHHRAFTPYVTGLDPLANIGSAAGAYCGGQSIDWREFMVRHSDDK